MVSTPLRLVAVSIPDVIVSTVPTVIPTLFLTLMSVPVAINLAASVPISLAVLFKVTLPLSVYRPRLVAFTVPSVVWVILPDVARRTTWPATSPITLVVVLCAVIPSLFKSLEATEPSVFAVRVLTTTRSTSMPTVL